MSDKKACIEAYHEMEERYAMLEIRFFSEEQKSLIKKALSDAIKEYEISPEIVVEYDDNDRSHGMYIIEFHDDYDRESGDFFEKIIKDLDIGKCVIDR
ncbi:MAG: hypothetical protein GXO12_05275 [Epsilonproteobacteria bacterium]|nr:hypothetical protein [Campylobacterota bacterium]